MSGDLVERVARAIAAEFESPGASPHGWQDEARAAIRVVVEECAKKAEGRYWSSVLGSEGTAKAIAAAIRALQEDRK